jgi:hypothetical protein
MFARVNLLITNHLLRQTQINNGYTIPKKNLQAIQAKKCYPTIIYTSTEAQMQLQFYQTVSLQTIFA